MPCRRGRWLCLSGSGSLSPRACCTGPWSAPMAADRKPESGRYSYDGLDRVIHEKARLGILTGLLGRPDGLLFNDLKALCALTDGNLSRHLAILQGAGLV